MSEQPSEHARGRLHVRRRGRTTPSQARALAALSHRFLLELPAGADVLDRAFWQGAFGREAPLAVEVGFGNGVALARLARCRPHWNCLGVDVYRPGFGALMRTCERDGVDNVRIVEADARELLRRLAKASLRTLRVYFPDPWPKKRHHKRRLVNDDFAALAAHCLEPGGRIRLATDWQHYAEQMLAAFEREPRLAGGETERPGSRPLTPFERKAIDSGRGVVDLAYRRTSQPPPSTRTTPTADTARPG